MQTTLENRKKVVAKSPINVFKRKNRAEKGGASSSGVKKEQESTKARAQKNDEGHSDTIYSANICTSNANNGTSCHDHMCVSYSV
jgi:hypothetical protein